MGKSMNGNKINPIKTYRKELLNKKVELLMYLGCNFKKLADADRNSNDDLIVASQDEFLQLGLDRALYGQLRDVESALDRLGSGEYGTCANCGDSISPMWTRAQPRAGDVVALALHLPEREEVLALLSECGWQLLPADEEAAPGQVAG